MIEAKNIAKVVFFLAVFSCWLSGEIVMAAHVMYGDSGELDVASVRRIHQTCLDKKEAFKKKREAIKGNIHEFNKLAGETWTDTFFERHSLSAVNQCHHCTALGNKLREQQAAEGGAAAGRPAPKSKEDFDREKAAAKQKEKEDIAARLEAARQVAVAKQKAAYDAEVAKDPDYPRKLHARSEEQRKARVAADLQRALLQQKKGKKR